MNTAVLQRCPVCRARLDDSDNDGPCPRCSADLALVRTAYRAAGRHQALARRHIVEARGGEAVREALRAIRLVDHPSTRATLLAALAAARRS